MCCDFGLWNKLCILGWCCKYFGLVLQVFWVGAVIRVVECAVYLEDLRGSCCVFWVVEHAGYFGLWNMLAILGCGTCCDFGLWNML